MATFRFEIMYKGLGRVAHFSATMQSLKLGYHYLWVSPTHHQGTSLATLFVHIDVQTYFSDPAFDIEGDGTLSMTRHLQSMFQGTKTSSSSTSSLRSTHSAHSLSDGSEGASLPKITNRNFFKKAASDLTNLSVCTLFFLLSLSLSSLFSSSLFFSYLISL